MTLVKVLNIDKSESSLSEQQLILPHINNESFIISDADEELLILLEFKQIIHLKSIKMHVLPHNDSYDGTETSPPKTVHIYHLNHLNVDFDDINNKKPDKTINCIIKKLAKGQNMNLSKIIRFKKTKYCAIYIKTNQNETETTYLNGITLNISSKNSTYTFDKKDEETKNELNTLINNNELNKETTMNNDDPNHLLQANDEQKVADNCKLSKCVSLQRVMNIIRRHHNIIQQCDEKQNVTETVFEKQIRQNMIAVYDTDDNVKLLNDYNHLLMNHKNEFEDVHNILKSGSNDNKSCDLSNCLMLRRNRRDRGDSYRKKESLNDLYFSDDIQCIVRQQLFDRIHSHYFHTFDIGYKMPRKERERIINEDVKLDADDENNIYIDKAAYKINKWLQSKQNSKLNNLPSKTDKFMITQDNMVNDDKMDTYSYGIRYFYWDFYKNNTEIVDEAHNRSHCIEINAMGNMNLYRSAFIHGGSAVHKGYNTNSITTANGDATLSHWYVNKKYKDLKDELLHNKICVILIKEYETMLLKAQNHHNTDMVKGLHCDDPGNDYHINFSNYYEIKHGQIMEVDHLIAMMVQCNCDVLQNQLRRTYRREPPTETDKQLLERHRNFYWLGRRLRECVECFGMSVHKNITLWQGVNKQFKFTSMYAYIKGPCSTTTDYTVAVNFCANTGMVLKLMTDKDWILTPSRMCGFDCQWISNYSNECEIFSIGGLYKLIFTQIIDAPTGTNYDKYIKGMKQMTYGMSLGDWIALNKAEEKDEKQMVFRLLSDELYRYYPDHQHAHQFTACPVYVRSILHEHCKSIKNIIFPENEASQKIMQIFKYDNEWIKLDLLLSVFPNIVRIDLNATNKEITFIQQKVIYNSILALLEINKETKLQCIEVKLNDLWRDDVDQFAMTNGGIIMYYRNEFKKYGWKLNFVWTDVQGPNMADNDRFRLIMKSEK